MSLGCLFLIYATMIASYLTLRVKLLLLPFLLCTIYLSFIKPPKLESLDSMKKILIIDFMQLSFSYFVLLSGNPLWKYKRKQIPSLEFQRQIHMLQIFAFND
eukprot:UN16313